MKLGPSIAAALAALAGAASASAQTTPAASPPPYSLPWQLRPAVAATVVRSDTTVASHDDAAGDGTFTIASMLLASYKVTPELAPFVRFGVVGTPDAAAIANPAFGATFSFKLPEHLRLALFLGLTVPVGMGGGDTPDKDTAAAAKAGILARSAMDNAMFAVNDFTIFPGVDLAWVDHGLTFQIEATILGLSRVRGSAVQKDARKVNFTSGLHVGYFVIPELSLGAEIRHQRWLSTPKAVAADATDSLRDTTTFAIGPRAHLKLGPTTWLRPGIAYARGIDDPMGKAGYNNVQIDLPLSF